MCINFFYPLIKKQDLEAITDILGIKGAIDYNYEITHFEKASKTDEDMDKNATNFDFYIELNSGIKVYFEIKYTENEFGKAKYDDKHKDKYLHIYTPLLANNPAIKVGVKDEKTFLDNYQIMRNLLHIDKDSYVVFIYPQENKGISQGVSLARNEIIENGWENHFIPIAWEDIVEQLGYRLKADDILDYYEDFENKYLKY
jgi:hypothetical protein